MKAEDLLCYLLVPTPSAALQDPGYFLLPFGNLLGAASPRASSFFESCGPFHESFILHNVFVVVMPSYILLCVNERLCLFPAGFKFISLEEGMATLSSILVWRIPWTEEGITDRGLQPMGSQRVGHD